MRYIALGFAFVLLIGAAPAVAQSSSDAASRPTNGPKNVILLLPDGFGPASATMARDYLRATRGITTLPFDSLQTGSVRTFSTSSRVTDSGAGATAYATGVKTYNGAIAVDTSKQPLATLLEAAEANGMATGLVVTSRLTHATPAAFSAHVTDRWQENEIASQQLDRDIDVLLGGGRRHFIPKGTPGSERDDTRNLLDEARENGYQVVSDRDGLRQIVEGPVLGLFSLDHMSYELDRDPAAQPSLAEMTTKAIELLRRNEKGYFLMVEGSRIDHAGHDNDAAAHLHDILAFNAAASEALKAARDDGNTLVISVSDHETGGLTLGRNVSGDGLYAWKPGVLSQVRATHGIVMDSIRRALESAPAPPDASDRITETVVPVFKHFTGIDSLDVSEIDRLRTTIDDPSALNFALSEIIGRRAIVGWTTKGHTAVDVGLYAYGPGRDRFYGNHDNTHVGQALAALLGFDLDALTVTLRRETTAAEPQSGSR